MPDTAAVVEVRCPLGPRRLFSKLRLGPEPPRYIQPDNLIEFACADCRNRLTRERATPCWVFHRYNFLGELVETIVVDGPPPPRSD